MCQKNYLCIFIYFFCPKICFLTHPEKILKNSLSPDYSKSKINTTHHHQEKQTHLEIIAMIVDILFNVIFDHSILQPYFVNNNPKLNSEDQKAQNLVLSTQEEVISSLYAIFCDFTKRATSSKQRKRRNDLLMLFTMLVEHNPTFFVSSGIMNTLLIYSIQPEYSVSLPAPDSAGLESASNSGMTNSGMSQDNSFYNLKINYNSEDFEFKKLTWLFVNKIAAFPAALRSISDSNVLEIFFEFISPNLATIWTNAQKNELQILALDCLCNLTPILLEDFMNCKGVTKLIIFLLQSLENQPRKSNDAGASSFLMSNSPKSGAAAAGNSLTPNNINENDKVSLTLKVIRQIIVLDCEPINSEFVDQGLIQILLNELKSRLNISPKYDLTIKKDLLFILAVLCEYNSERKDILGEMGVLLLIQYLKYCINGLHSSEKESVTPSDQQILVVYVVDCIWACISGSLRF